MTKEIGVGISAGVAVAKFLPEALNIAKSVWGKVDQSLSNSIRSAHLEYAVRVIERHSRAKTFLIRAAPVYLYDFYVPSSVECDGGRRVERVDLGALHSISNRVIVAGSGGSGKTILMKHLLLSALSDACRFPILIELKNLNDNERSLSDEIVDNLRSHGFDLDDNYIDKSIKEGVFVLLLDGFDEVQKSHRARLEREIRAISNSSKCQIVITSRNDTTLQSWSQFTVVNISRLTLEEACELVDKVNFDSDVKGRFLQNLKGGLFNSHSFFLSNPLLLSIMLLTYGDSADIPRKLSSFYHQAYEALFHGHDALKSSFKRDRATDLDIYEFARLFSAFCMLTFDARAFRFSRTEAIKYVKKGAELAGFSKVSPDGFIDDARQAVCMLIEDGLDLAFIHRSFQEYFAARFISEASEDLKKRLVERVTKNSGVSFSLDNVVELLHEMAPDCVERYFIIPGLESFFGDFAGRKISRSFWLEKMKINMSQIMVNFEGDRRLGFVVAPKAKDYALISFVARKYDVVSYLGKEEWFSIANAFIEKHGIDKSIRVKDLSIKSPLIADLSELNPLWSVSGLEALRKAYRGIRRSSDSRVAAVDKLFLT